MKITETVLLDMSGLVLYSTLNTAETGVWHTWECLETAPNLPELHIRIHIGDAADVIWTAPLVALLRRAAGVEIVGDSWPGRVSDARVALEQAVMRQDAA